MKKVFIYGFINKAKNYVIALKNAGITTVVSTNIAKAEDCCGLVLRGGGDIYPFLYGKNIKSNCIEFKRDIAELLLIERFYAKNLPILGVCRGMQILNVAFGGTIDNISKSNVTHFKQSCDALHSVYNLGGFTKEIYAKKFVVNSAHHQQIGLLSPHFDICAISNDNVIEAFQHKNKTIFGVQFHPERMNNGYLIYDYFSKIL